MDFVKKLARHIVEPQPWSTTDCWTWKGAVSKPRKVRSSRTRTNQQAETATYTYVTTVKPTPLMRVGNSMTSPNRVIYEHFIGPLAENQQLRRRCGNPLCVSPHHREVKVLLSAYEKHFGKEWDELSTPVPSQSSDNSEIQELADELERLHAFGRITIPEAINKFPDYTPEEIAEAFRLANLPVGE